MKKLLIEGLLVGCFLLIGVSSAQNFNFNSQNFSPSSSKDLKSVLNEMFSNSYGLKTNVKQKLQKTNGVTPYLVDTVIVNGTENNYRYSFTYDSKGKVKSQLKEILKNNKYENFELENYSFDYDSNVETFKGHKWENGDWKMNAMYTRLYNSDGNEIQSIFYSNFFDGTWKPSDRITITYHFGKAFSCLLDEIYYEGSWRNSFRIIQKIDEKLRTTDLISEWWESDKWSMEENSRHFDYDTLNDTTFSITRIWKGNSWINQELEKYLSNSENGNRTSIVYKWDENNWDLDHKWYSSKNENGTKKIYSNEFWSNNICDSINRTTDLYDPKKNIQSSLKEIFKSGNWLNKTKENYIYDENGNVKKFEARVWKNSTWLPVDYIYGLQYLRSAFGGSDVTLQYKSYDQLVRIKESKLPSGFELYQNYPNPFNPETTIKYSIPVNVETLHATSLRVYDILGREVATLVNQKQAPGNYEVKFDGSKLASGVYIYKLQSGSFVQTKKFVLMK